MEIDSRVYPVRLIVRPLPGIAKESGLFALILQSVSSLEDQSAEGGEMAPGQSIVEQLENELRTTRANLQSAMEELEASNEELKSSNEELISTNEELQSANEELQTSKEELQASNEELHVKVEELDSATSDLQYHYAGTQIATIFLDRNLRITRFTPAATKLFHVLPGDIGRPLRDLALHFGEEDLFEAVESVLKSEAAVEKNVYKADRSICYLVRILPYRRQDRSVAGVGMTFVDVTSLKKAEESHTQLTTELGHRVEELQAILDAAPVAVWIASDPLCRKITGNAYANQVVMRSQPNDNVSQTALPGEATVAYKMFRKGIQLAPDELPAQVAAATGRRVPSEELELVFEDGRRLTLILGAVPLLDAHGLPRGSVTAGADITDRKRAEEALRQSETKYRVVADNTYDWEFWVDSQGRFIYSSPSCERITGHKPEEFLANPDLRTTLLHPDDRASHTRHKREIEMMRTTREEEWRIAGPDGSWRWMAHVCQPVYDGDGKFIGTRGTNRDITDRKQAVAAQEAERRLLEMILELIFPRRLHWSRGRS